MMSETEQEIPAEVKTPNGVPEEAEESEEESEEEETSEDEDSEPAAESEPDLAQAHEFTKAVESVYQQIQGDPDKRDKALAEIYVFMRTLDQAVRKMMSSGGPMAVVSRMMGGKTEA